MPEKPKSLKVIDFELQWASYAPVERKGGRNAVRVGLDPHEMAILKLRGL